MSKKAVVFREIKNREKEERLTRICQSEFFLISAEAQCRIWFDDIEGILYREYTCNGPSSWASAPLPDSADKG